MIYDTDRDDLPTRASLEHDELVEKIRDENHKYLMENDTWYKRAYEILENASHDMLKTKLYKAIANKILVLQENSYKETRDAMLDEAAYASDPMAYHGVSWSDFI